MPDLISKLQGSFLSNMQMHLEILTRTKGTRPLLSITCAEWEAAEGRVSVSHHYHDPASEISRKRWPQRDRRSLTCGAMCLILELWENVLLGLNASSPQTILVAHVLVASYQPLLLLQTQKVQTPYSCSVLVASFLWAHIPTQYKGLISGFLDHVLHTHMNRIPPTRFYKSLSPYPVSFQVLWPISAPKPSCFQRPGEQMSLDPIRYFPFPHHALRTPPFPMFANRSPLSSHQYFLSSLWSYLLFKSTARPNKVWCCCC